jgi:hypothetical protein
MKTNNVARQSFRPCPGGLILALAFLLSASAALAEAGYAIVQKIQGTATYASGIGEGALKSGQRLDEGTRITTGNGSYVDLNLGDNGDALRIGEASVVTLTELTVRKLRKSTVVRTEVNVTRGKVVANVIKKLNRSSRYRVKTPQWVAGIRGTCIEAGVAGLVAITGTVQFTQANGQVQMVIGGFAYSTGGNQPQQATAAQTQGIAASATSSTANLGNAALVQATVQQFAQAIASRAALNAPNAQAAATAASQTAAAVVQALTQAVLQEAQNAPAEIRAQVQQAVQVIQQQAAAITVTAAAAAAATATVAIVTGQGSTPQQAEQQAEQAAQQAADQAGQIAIEQAGQGNNQAAAQATAQQVAQVKQEASNVAKSTITSVQRTLSAGGNASQALNSAVETTPTISVSPTGQTQVTPRPVAPGAQPVSSDLSGLVQQVGTLSGQTAGQTIGTLAQIVADPFLAAGLTEVVSASQQPGGLAAAIQNGGGLSSSAQAVLATLGVGGVGGIGTQANAGNAGGQVGAAAGTNPASNTRPPSSP